MLTLGENVTRGFVVLALLILKQSIIDPPMALYNRIEPELFGISFLLVSKGCPLFWGCTYCVLHSDEWRTGDRK